VLQDCSLIFLSQDVPTDDRGESSLEALTELLESIRPHIAPQTIVIVLCQVPPGFTRELAEQMVGKTEPSQRLYYQVETLIFGRAVERALKPERFIVGCAHPDEPLAEDYAEYLHSFGCPILPMRYESAELAKISINACLVASVTTANTLADLCERIGADWGEIVPALRLDARIGPQAYLAPGLGIAGGNLERDLATIARLARQTGADAGTVEAFIADSRHRKEWVVHRLHSEVFPQYTDPRIAVWGLAYKENTRSIKNSPALALLDRLKGRSVSCYDPVVRLDSLPEYAVQVGSALEACAGADVLVVMTKWQEFVEIDPASVAQTMSGRQVIDPFSGLDGGRYAELGFDHIHLGVR
jgi:UDPglucose 6-dehydrogenase